MRVAPVNGEHVIVDHPFARSGGLRQQCLDGLGAAIAGWSRGLVLPHPGLLLVNAIQHPASTTSATEASASPAMCHRQCLQECRFA